MKSIVGWIVAYLARWLPHSYATGLTAVGSPDQDSPVIVTCNFSLTVKRMQKALRGLNVWLLVAPSDGINVWCAACGGIFTHNRVIDAIKVSGLADKVKHRVVILPALSAPAMDKKKIKEETGFSAKFGPVYAGDIPEYLELGQKKTDGMRRFRFDLKHRLDMLVSMNLPIYILPAIVLAIFFRDYLLGFSVLFWAAVALLYFFLNVIPGKTGWGRSIYAAVFFILAWAAIDWVQFGSPLHHWGWLIAASLVFFSIGFDLSGIASAEKSDAEEFVQKLGIKSIPGLFNEKELGDITLDRDKCIGCKTCLNICPTGAVYAGLDPDKKITFQNPDACFACGACTMQCPEEALSLG